MMRATIALGSAIVVLAVYACSSASEAPTADTADAGASDDAGQDAAPDAPTSGCKLGAVEKVDPITPTIVLYDPPSSVPPPMTGGHLAGSYAVTAATFYLPQNLKSVAHPDKSTGRVTAWSVFDGTSYRIFLHAGLTIDTSIGPNQQNTDVDSQGSFTVNGATLTFDYACDKELPDPIPDYTFTDDGSGTSKLVIKSTTAFGDGYLLLEATRR